MGAAKNRGSREMRIAESIAKQKNAELEQQRKLAEPEAAVTPEQKAIRKQARHKLALLSAFATGINI